MTNPETCTWYSGILEQILLNYFRITKKELLLMLAERQEKVISDDRSATESFVVTFKHSEQKDEKESIKLFFQILPSGEHVFMRLRNTYRAADIFKYRFTELAPRLSPICHGA